MLEATFLQSHTFLAEFMCKIFWSKVCNNGAFTNNYALTKDTARENRANPAFGSELTLVTAQDSSDIGAAPGLDVKVLTS